MRNLLPALAAVQAAALLAAPAAQAASPRATLGVYAGGGAPAKVAAFERWNGGQRTSYALEFLPMHSWKELAHPDWWAARWRSSPQRMVYSVPLLPRAGGTLRAGAEGAYDSHFASMARTLVAHGQAHAILRLGWEFNGDWFPWAASRDPGAFVTYWRRVVTAIRGVPGARFAIDWTPNVGRSAIAPDRVYPGDRYVDVIGMDAYDMGWGDGWLDPAKRWHALVEQPYGLAWQRSFAAAHGKPTSIPEWGMMISADGHGGGDDPYYVRHMHDWIAGGNVLYHDYFEYDSDVGRHRMMNGEFPAGAAEFRRLFGPGAAAPRVRVRLLRVRRLARGVAVAGRVTGARPGGVVRLSLRAGRTSRTRAVRVGAGGRFSVRFAGVPGARVRLVARYGRTAARAEIAPR